jgi:hypothetical protein
MSKLDPSDPFLNVENTVNVEPQMPKKPRVVELLEAANRYYPDGLLCEYF